jgi:hypothetical protein
MCLLYYSLSGFYFLLQDFCLLLQLQVEMVLFGFLILQNFCFIFGVAHWSTSYRSLSLQAILKFLVSQNFKHKHQTKVNCKQVGKWFLPPRILNTKNQLQESWIFFFFHMI